MDWILNDELKATMQSIGGHMAAAAMVVGGVVPYIPQYLQIRKTQDPEGFSLHVCLALLIANSLRILFWFAELFEYPLLIQSVLMNITMFLMIHLCVKVRRNNQIMRTRDRVFAGDEATVVVDDSTTATNRLSKARGSVEHSGGNPLSPLSSPPPMKAQKHYLTDFDLRYFWAWTDFQSYLDFMLVFWAVGAAVTYVMLPVDWFMQSVGFMAAFTEAMLGAPQFIRNFQNKSTIGMSIHMVIMWTIGDLFKTCYFILRNSPVQFWFCGILQVSLDIMILLQVVIYRKNTKPRAHRGD